MIVSISVIQIGDEEGRCVCSIFVYLLKFPWHIVSEASLSFHLHFVLQIKYTAHTMLITFSMPDNEIMMCFQFISSFYFPLGLLEVLIFCCCCYNEYFSISVEFGRFSFLSSIYLFFPFLHAYQKVGIVHDNSYLGGLSQAKLWIYFLFIRKVEFV